MYARKGPLPLCVYSVVCTKGQWCYYFNYSIFQFSVLIPFVVVLYLVRAWYFVAVIQVPWLYWEGCTVYCTSHSLMLDLLGLRKRTGAMTVLRGLSSVLHITQPKVGSCRVKEKNRWHDCSGMYSLLHTTQPKVWSFRVKEKNRRHGSGLKKRTRAMAHSQRLDLLGLRKRKGAMAELRGLYSHRLELLGLRKRTGAMAVLRGL